MSIETALWYEAVHTTAVAAIISTRFYPAGSVPASAPLPRATYQLITNEHHRWQGGRSGLARPQIQVDCYARTKRGASDLAEVFRLTFDGYRGYMGEAGSTIFVNLMTLDTETALYEPPSDASQRGTHRVSMDWLIWHAET